MNNRSKLVTILIFLLILATFTLTTGFSYVTLQNDAIAPEETVQPIQVYPFSDIKGHWAEAAIAEMYAKNVMKGYGDFTFRPNKPVTFLEAVVMTGSLLGPVPSKEEIEANSYLKMNFNIPEWSVGYVSWALRNELLLYSELQKAALQQPLTRQEATILAIRALGLEKQAKKIKDVTLPFTDSALIDANAAGYVSLACERKIINGFPNGTFQPGSPISRAEISILLSNVADQIPYVNSDEISGFFKSFNKANNSIILTNLENKEKEIILPSSYLLYLNNKPSTIDKLSAGNHIRIIAGESNILTVLVAKAVIPDSGLLLATEQVKLALEPIDVQQWVETNKIHENYILQTFKGGLYILATRGEKMTGGYTVDIIKVSSTNDEKGINYRVWLKRSDPSRDALVNQVISYPFALVKVESPKTKILTVTFVDELNQVLAEIKLQ